jgi:hypothetical protein
MGNSKNAQKRQPASARPGTRKSKKTFGDENSTPVAKPNIPTKPPRPRPIPRKRAAQNSHVAPHNASTDSERAGANAWDDGVDTAAAATLLSMSRGLRTQSLALNVPSEQFNSPSLFNEDPEIHDTEESVADEDDHGSAESKSEGSHSEEFDSVNGE